MDVVSDFVRGFMGIIPSDRGGQQRTRDYVFALALLLLAGFMVGKVVGYPPVAADARKFK